MYRIAVLITATLVTVAGSVAQDYADIRLPNQLVARMRAPGPHGSLAQREAVTYQRITNALSTQLPLIFDKDLGGPRLTVHQVNGVWTLSIGPQILIQAFPEDAAGAGTTTRALIDQWRANFAQQLPRAVSPMQVPQWWQEANPERVGTEEKRSHDLPSHDAVLVREVAEILDAAREMPTEQFQALETVMERALLYTIWTYRHPECGEPPVDQHIRCRSVLRRAHGLDDQQYANEKWWLAGATITHMRGVMDIPEGVGPIPQQRDLPDFTEPLEPITAPTAPEPEPAVTPEPAVATEPAVTPDMPVEPEQAEAPEPITIADGSPIQIAAIGTGLGESGTLQNMGQQFMMPIDQLMVYLQIADAPADTVLGVILHDEGGIVAQRRIPVMGDRRLAVSFSVGKAGSFDVGRYECNLTINGEDAGRIPFHICTEAGNLIER